MAKKDTILQHYIPQFQLRYLADENDKKLYVYDRLKNEIRKQGPKSIGAINKFYTYKDKSGKEHTEVEDLNAQIEGIAAPLIEELHNGKKSITQQEKADLSVLLTLNWLRTPAAKERTELLFEAGAKMHMRINALEKDLFFKQIDELQMKTGKEYGDKEELRQSVLNDRYRVKFDNIAHIKSMMLHLLDLSATVQSMEWNIAILNKDKSFIFSDINFTVEQVKNPPMPYGERGLLSPGSQSMCVLTHKVAIFLRPRPGGVNFIYPDSKFVRNSNIISALRSQRFVFSHSETLLRSLIERIKLYNIPVNRPSISVYSGPENKEFIFKKED